MDPVSIALGFVGKHWRVFALVGLLAFAGIQTARVSRLKADVRTEQAAQINPATKKAWKSEAIRSAADLLTCRGNVASLDVAITRQNAAVSAKAASDKARLDLAERGLAEARTANARSADQIARLMRPLDGGDTCTRLLEVDKRLMETLQ